MPIPLELLFFSGGDDYIFSVCDTSYISPPIIHPVKSKGIFS
jgi:hypothetical protein